MENRLSTPLKVIVSVTALLVLLLIVWVGLSAFKSSNSPAPQPVAVASPTAIEARTLAAEATATPAPTGTPTTEPEPAALPTAATILPPPAPPPSETPAPAPPAPPTATAASAAAPVKTAVPAKQQAAVATLPNGVRYGDRTPNLPDRIVRIASPDIKLDAKTYEIYSPKGVWEVAEYAAGHHYNSKNPGEGGNIVMSGHNNWKGEVFRYLEFLKPGNTIWVWTLDGKKYTYQVESVQKLKEAGAPLAQRIANGKVMDPTPFEQLTLITCWPYTTYTHRLIVTAKPVAGGN